MPFTPTHLLLILAIAMLVFGTKTITQLARDMSEALSNFRGRGGPGSTVGPLPSNDSRILNRKRTRRQPE